MEARDAVNILKAILNQDRDLAWGLIQNLTGEELDEFEDHLDQLQDLVDFRHAAEALIRAVHLLDKME